jgi:type IV pilus assembly protein PilC
MSAKDRMSFAKRLSVLISAQLPILKALQIIKNQTDGRRANFIIEKIIFEVENGQFLSSAMSQFGKVFSEFEVSIVRIGEVSGSLSGNLSYLAEELKKKQELKKKIVSALIYPGLIVTMTFGITGLLAVYVLPKILPIFISFKSELPWSTRTLIFFTNFLAKDWVFVLIIVLAVLILIPLVLRVAKIRKYFDRLILRLPVLGDMFRSFYLANFCRTLGLLLKSDVVIMESIKITSATVFNQTYKIELDKIGRSIQKGGKLSEQMVLSPKIFPPLLVQMIIVGEATGSLSDSLLYLTKIYEEELNDLTKNLSVIIEPVLMIFMGIIVGFVAISIITPIYGIAQNLHP